MNAAFSFFVVGLFLSACGGSTKSNLKGDIITELEEPATSKNVSENPDSVEDTKPISRDLPSEIAFINDPPPTIKMVNPFFRIEKDKIKAVRFSFGGDWGDRECTVDDRDFDGTHCGETSKLSPGPHVLRVVFCSDIGCRGFGPSYRSYLKFSAKPREEITIDLQKLALDKGQPLTRKGVARKSDSACVRAMEELFLVNTCTAKGYREFDTALTPVQKSCQGLLEKEDALLIRAALWTSIRLEPQRCYTPKEIERMPGFLTSWYVSKGFWPKGTIRNQDSSWAWARTPKKDLLEFGRPISLSDVKGQVQIFRDRQIVVDELIDVSLDSKKHLPRLLESSRKTKFDFNPSTPAGHRNYGLSKLAEWNDTVMKHKGVSAILANGSQHKGANGEQRFMVCGTNETRSLLRAFLADNEITKKEWNTVLSWVKHTDKDTSLSSCDSILNPDDKSSISISTRLEEFAALDCDPKRDKEVRGRTISRVFRSWEQIPRKIRVPVMRKFKHCIAF